MLVFFVIMSILPLSRFQTVTSFVSMHLDFVRCKMMFLFFKGQSRALLKSWLEFVCNVTCVSTSVSMNGWRRKYFILHITEWIVSLNKHHSPDKAMVKLPVPQLDSDWSWRTDQCRCCQCWTPASTGLSVLLYDPWPLYAERQKMMYHHLLQVQWSSHTTNTEMC